MTRGELLANLEAGRRQAESRLTPESLERFGDWSAKDLLFHLAAWQRISGVQMTARRESGREASAGEVLGASLEAAEAERLLALDIDGINAYLFQRYRDQDWPAALSLWRESYELLKDEAARLTDEQLAQLSGGEPLWQRIGWDSFTHVAEHLGPSRSEQTAS